MDDEEAVFEIEDYTTQVEFKLYKSARFGV